MSKDIRCQRYAARSEVTQEVTKVEAAGGGTEKGATRLWQFAASVNNNSMVSIV